jgi:archaemetzincin
MCRASSSWKHSTRGKRTLAIYLLPVGAVEPRLLAKVSEKVAPVIRGLSIMKGIPVPHHAFAPSTGQYDSAALLEEACTAAPRDALRIIAVTEVDIFMPPFTYIFGRAYLDGKAAIVSFHRLRPEFYDEPSNQEITVERLSREILHELGHAFGLIHCDFPECAMSSASIVEHVDRKGLSFCPYCVELLKISPDAAECFGI